MKYPRLFTAGALTVILLAGLFVLLAVNWPFTRGRVIQSLQEASLSKASVRGFHSTYFPHPGAVLENLTLARDLRPGAPPLIAITKLTIEASWPDLLTLRHRVSHMRAEGARVSIPEKTPPPVPGIEDKTTDTLIGELIADGAVLEIATSSDSRPLRFQLPQLTFHDASYKTPLLYSAVVQNPNPPGTIQSNGSFGPWDHGNPAMTPLSGTFNFTNADLGFYRGIGGTLASKGEFKGALGQIQTQGEVDIPNFRVDSRPHTIALRAAYQAQVNGLNGDVVLQRVDSEYLHTRIAWRGTIAGHPAKTASLDFSSSDARIQDLLLPFVKASNPPLNGRIVFSGHVVLPPGREPFLRRVALEGDFGIKDGQFTNRNTQANLNELSARASGEDKHEPVENPAEALSNLKGHVAAHNGEARFSQLSFAVPGAAAQLDGNFNLITERVDLHGTLSTVSSLSHDAGGIKSFLLKPFDPLFKKRQAGAVIPVSITGTYSHPSYTTSLVPVKTDGKYPRVKSSRHN